MSGMTRSIPNISSSGNMRPQSITTMSSPYSMTYMFLPISPTPPSGMIRSGVSPDGGAGVIDDLDFDFGMGPRFRRRSARPPGPGARRRRPGPGWVASCWRPAPDLVWLGVAVVGWPALHDVRDEDLAPAPAQRGEELHEEVAGPTDERPPEAVLVDPGPFADEDDLGVRLALAGHGVRPRRAEAAALAHANLGRDRLELDAPLVGGHRATAPAARRLRGASQSRSARISASRTAFVAAPTRRLSATIQSARPRPAGRDASRRMRPTRMSSVPAASVASGLTWALRSL